MSDKKPRGRPRIELDPVQVEKLARIGCKITEMADFFGCSKEVLERNYRAEMDRGYATMRQKLRRKQFNVAMRGNAVMLIWLGKQMLGQVDSIIQVHDFEEKRAKAMTDDELKAAAAALIKKAKD